MLTGKLEPPAEAALLLTRKSWACLPSNIEAQVHAAQPTPESLYAQSVFACQRDYLVGIGDLDDNNASRAVATASVPDGSALSRIECL